MKNSIITLITLFHVFYTQSYADILTGKVVSVTDGDTIKVLTKNKTLYKIRLNGIDAPERSQAFGKKSKANLSQLVAARIVDVQYKKTDMYGRILGTVFVDNNDINLRQIEDGYAWVYRRYCKRADYYKAEESARNRKLGLWYDKYPVPPWEYRKRKKK
jgi:endonuclease YncB( thermonuclease family)